jgi:1-acyl-sn-glycerol-3-phosphate acyltransferase
LAFAFGWPALETTGVAASAALSAAGRGKDHDAHFALQRWWADRLLDVLRHTAGLAFEAERIAALAPGPIVMCARHASLADALIPVWLLSQVRMHPRYMLKDDLQLDPCLDIVGNRLPNHFVDRDPGDTSDEIAAPQRLSHDIGQHDACMIFPEGLIATEATRARALERIAARDPVRFKRTSSLRVLAPVRPGGTAALLRGAPDADLVLVTHTGLESLQGSSTRHDRYRWIGRSASGSSAWRGKRYLKTRPSPPGSMLSGRALMTNSPAPAAAFPDLQHQLDRTERPSATGQPMATVRWGVAQADHGRRGGDCHYGHAAALRLRLVGTERAGRAGQSCQRECAGTRPVAGRPGGRRRGDGGGPAAACALNLLRLEAYWTSTPLDRQRTSHLARLRFGLAA